MIGTFSGPRGSGMSNKYFCVKNHLTLHTPAVSRRLAVFGCVSAAFTLSLPRAALSDPFAGQPLHQRARVLRQASLVVPAPPAGAPVGVSGADVIIPGRGSFGIDWVIAGNDTVTLMLLTASQKAQLTGGRPLGGDPLMRLEIEGPETAGHSANVTQGNYFIAFLNREPSEARLLYRASFIAF